MSLIKIERKRIRESNKCVETKVYKIIGIPIIRYTYIQEYQTAVAKGSATGRLALSPQIF